MTETAGNARSPAARSFAPRMNMLVVWHSAWDAWVAYAAPISLLAILGLTGPSILFAYLAQSIGISDFVHLSGPLVTYQGLANLSLPNNGAVLLLVAQSAFSACTSMLTQVGILWLILRRVTTLHFGHLLRALPMMGIAILIHGLFITVPVTAINVPLRGTAFDLDNLGQKGYSPAGIAQVILLRTFHHLVPLPDSPFREFLALGRQSLGSWPSVENSYSQHLADEYGSAVAASSTRKQTLGEDSAVLRYGFVIACLIVAWLTEILLRLQPAAILHATAIGGNELTAALHATGWTIKHFGHIAVLSLGLRLCVGVFMMVFLTIPEVIYESVEVTGYIGQVLAWLKLPLCEPFAFTAAWLMLNSIATSFVIACDAQIYLQSYRCTSRLSEYGDH